MANVIMASSLRSGISAKKFFNRSYLAVYKDRGVSIKEISQWIKLTLCFEDPGKSLTSPGMLFNEWVPRYADSFQTGVILFGFGVHTRFLHRLARYWQLEWIANVILGRQTVDHYSRSPLIQLNDYSHVTEHSIKQSLPKFIGVVEQTNPGPLFEDAYCPSDTEDHCDFEQINEFKQKTENQCPRLRQCHSIEVLTKNDCQIKLRIICDASFNCRSFIRDFGTELGCMSSIDSLELIKIGPIGLEHALKKHELHFKQMLDNAENITPMCVEYLKALREQYPEATSSYRYI